MPTLMYTTGNGYSCGCCRRTDSDWIDFDSTEDAVSQCISIAASYDWDFSVDGVRGVDGEEYELTNFIEQALTQSQSQHNFRYKVESKKRDIAAVETWFDDLEQTVADKREYLAKLKRELIELEGV